jgi:hypothetical protein
MEPVELLKQAVTTVEQASVPEDLRALAFAKILEILSEQSAPHRNADKEPHKDNREGTSASSGPLGRIAASLGISPALVDRIFDENEGELRFTGDVSALGKSRTDKVQNLAILLLAGLRWSDLDGGSATTDETVRAEVDRLTLLDVTNYTKQIAGLKPYVIITGSGRKATYKIKYDGIEKAKEIGRGLAGTE